MILFKDKVRLILAGLHFNEVYGSSFMGDEEQSDERSNGGLFGAKAEAVEVANPIAQDKKYLRSSLKLLLLKVVQANTRFFSSVAAFEIGKVFARHGEGVAEKLSLGLVLAEKKQPEAALRLKGSVRHLLEDIGLPEFAFVEHAGYLHIETNGQTIGELSLVDAGKQWAAALVEFDMEKLLEAARPQRAFSPLARHPSVMRDLSLFVKKSVRIGDIVDAISAASPKLVEDVDWIDAYADEEMIALGGQSLAFRIVFQAHDRTLNDEEVNSETEKIAAMLREKFGAQIR